MPSSACQSCNRAKGIKIELKTMTESSDYKKQVQVIKMKLYCLSPCYEEYVLMIVGPTANQKWSKHKD